MKCYLKTALLLLFAFTNSHLFSQTADQTQGCAPHLVNFTPPAGSTTFFWDFGDGVTSSEEMASHIYADVNADGYTVSFSETAGGPVIGTVLIQVYDLPELTVTADPTSGCAPLTTTITSDVVKNDAINIFNYTWSFGDGNTDNGPLESTISHTYQNPGDFDVFLEISTNLASCNVTESFPDLISASGPPNVGFVTVPNPAFSCTAPLTVNFANTTPGQGGLTFEWDFGNGNTTSSVNPPAQNYSDEGSFGVVLTATDGNGCSGTTESSVNIGAPLADFTPEKDTVCIGEIILMTNESGAGEYSWTFDNGAFPSATVEPSPLVQLNNPGIVTASLTVSANMGECENTIVKEIFVDDPNANFESIPTYSCVDSLEVQLVPENTTAAQYIWTFTNGGTSNDQSPTWVFNNEDTTIHGINGRLQFGITLTVVNASGCTATTTVQDTIHQPNALFYPSETEGCAPLDVTFEDRSENDFLIIAYEWDFGDGTTATVNTDDDQMHTYDDPGEYEVVLIVTDELGCKDTSYVQTIFVGEKLTPTFDLSAQQICPGESITVTEMSNSDLIDAWHFDTDNNRSFHCFGENTLTHAFDSETGFFDVSVVVEYNGCISDPVVLEDIVEVQGPIAKADFLVDCENPYDINFRDSSMDATSVVWEFGDLTDTTLNNLTHTYPFVGSYEVILTASNPGTGCPDSKDTVTVNVADITADITTMFMMDTIACLGVPYDLDGSASESVNKDCHRGYTWSFSDPNDRPVTTQNDVISHAFEQVGYNWLYLETLDINGCTANDSFRVKVFGVYPEFTIDPTPICVPSAISFTNTTTADTTIMSYMWDFGDGNTSEDVIPSHTYITAPANGESFTVTLTVQDSVECGSMSQIELPVYVPSADIQALPDLNLCVGESVDFSAVNESPAGVNLDYSWNFGNSQTSMNASETVIYGGAGNFQVTLNVVEQGTNCPGEQTSVNVDVQDFPDADFSTSEDGNTVICAPTIIDFTDESVSSSPLDVAWDFGNGDFGFGDMATSGYNKGVYTVVQTVTTSNGCSDTHQETLTLVGPEGQFTADKTVICLGDEITFTLSDTVDVSSWTWDFGDGTVQTGGLVVTHLYDNPLQVGQTIVTLVIEGIGGNCSSAFTTDIFIQDAFADFLRGNNDADSLACVGDPIQFLDLSVGATTWDWDFGDGNFSSNQNPGQTFAAAGNYDITLEVESSIGCSSSITKQVTVEAVPEVSVEDASTCQNTATTLEGIVSGDFILEWSPAALVTNSVAASTMTVPLTVTTDFTLTATSPLSGCIGFDIATVVVQPELMLPDSFGVLACPGQPIVLPVTNSSGAYTYEWSVSGDLTLEEITGLCDNCNSPVITLPNMFEEDDSMAVIRLNYGIGTGDNRICTGVFDYPISLLNNSIPNAFTPDGDGLNDFFNIDIQEAFEVEAFEIFNRWGQKIYDNDSPATGWNGTINGNPAPTEVYLFNFKTSNEGCKFSGNVTLIR